MAAHAEPTRLRTHSDTATLLPCCGTHPSGKCGGAVIVGGLEMDSHEVRSGRCLGYLAQRKRQRSGAPAQQKQNGTR
eukprot:192709-Pyramimonas_sp.AAC.2